MLAAASSRPGAASGGGAADTVGELLEVPVKRILLGAGPASVASRESLASPEALDYFAELASSLSSSQPVS